MMNKNLKKTILINLECLPRMYQNSEYYRQLKEKNTANDFPIEKDKYWHIQGHERTDKRNRATTAKSLIQFLYVGECWEFDELPWVIIKSFEELSTEETDLFYLEFAQRKVNEKFKWMLAAKDKLIHMTDLPWLSLHGHLDMITYYSEELHHSLIVLKAMENAAMKGHLVCMMYLRRNRCPWNEEVCSNAASGGYLDCLKYLHEQRCPWDSDTCAYAARYGHLDCLQYAHEQGCKWNFLTCANAAENGHLDCLKYAHENGCPWVEEVCSNAATNGHLECLKYAHEHGCPWDKQTCLVSAFNSRFECFKYAMENDCPRDKKTIQTAIYFIQGFIPYAKSLGISLDGMKGIE